MFNKKQWKNIDKISGWLVVVGAMICLHYAFEAFSQGRIHNEFIAFIFIWLYALIIFASVLSVFRNLTKLYETNKR